MKKRIRRALNLTALITVLFLSGVIIFIILSVSKLLVAYQSEKVASAIQQDINSGSAAEKLGIHNIEEMDLNDARTKLWIDSLHKSNISNDFYPYIGEISHIYIKIEVNEKTLYSNENEIPEGLEEFYDSIKAEKPIFDRDNNEIGSITVIANAEIVLTILISVSGAVILLGLAALLIAKVLGMFLILPVINPINQLEKKVKAIADGDQETATNTQLALKKPLREIESLMDSTNRIMNRLHGYNELLESQKELLENQNSELEMQNEELTESKLHIQQQQAQLVQSEKMASVGMLTAAITHEINTPIGAIHSNAQLADMLLKQSADCPAVREDEELSTIFNQMKEVNDVNLIACNRIIEIIRSLKSFSRLDQADYQEANINEGIKSVLVLTHNLLKQRITVHEDYEDLPPVRCFPGQLNQVIMNIVVNAFQAIEGEGDIFIHTCQKDRDIFISVRDTGTGIKPENISKLFDPGYTTKGVGVGLGLGLYISYNIIQNHKGEISVVSEPGRGAEFIIRIPMDSDEPEDKIRQ